MGFERGTVIAGKYCVERILGEGGMGVVFAARHLGLDEMVAVKLIREGLADGSQALARFQREARAVARLKSEHVARVLDVDALPAENGVRGAPYIVMELIDGVDLHALLDRGPISIVDAVTYVSQACEGLAEAHALGMVHRDLNLKNLFLTHRRDGRPLIKVIDFGVVKLAPTGDDIDNTQPIAFASTQLAHAAGSLTGTAMLVGSVHYMAPEQIRASNIVDARADVWSLGVCLYRMLAGVLPFEGNTIAAICFGIQGRAPTDVRELAPHVPADVAAAVMRALEKDVARRFQDVAAFAHALASHSLDPGGAARVETILQSGVRPITALAPVVGRDGEMTITNAVAPGRIESTIAAAAVDSGPRPVPATSKRSFLTGALLLAAAAAITFTVAARFRAAPVATTIAAPTPPPTLVPTAVATPLQPPPPMPSLLVPSATGALPRPAAAPRRPAGASTKKQPKPEPTNAYDTF